MKLLVYTYYPFFDKHLGGGVQTWLRNLLDYINRNYEDVELTVLCPDSSEYPFPVDIRVLHEINDLESDYLEPRDIFASHQIIRNAVDDSDVVWLIDRMLPFSVNKPCLLSLNAICYRNEITAFFNSESIPVIVPSNYTRDKLLNIGKDNNLISTIPYYSDMHLNHVDHETAINVLSKYFKYEESKHYILFPHRPEKDKGHALAIEIMQKLTKVSPNYILLIPEPPFSRVDDIVAEKKYIDSIKALVKEKKLSSNVIFHPWIHSEDLSAYYSIGKFTLFLSKLPETFGLSLLNSVLCGTPVISYGSGALKETIPPGNSHFIFNEEDVDGIVKRIINGVTDDSIISDIHFINEKYAISSIAEQYVTLIKNMAD